MFGLPKNSQRKSGMLVAWNALCFIFLPVTCKLSECDLVLWVICLQIYRSLRGRVLWYPAIRRLPQWLATELAIVSVVMYTIHGITHRFWDLWVLRASGSSLALSIPNKRTTHERSGCLINSGRVWVEFQKIGDSFCKTCAKSLPEWCGLCQCVEDFGRMASPDKQGVTHASPYHPSV